MKESHQIKNRFSGLIWAALVCICAIPGAAAAQGSAGAQAELLQNDAPLHVASDRMEADQKKRIITFLGHVVVQQGDMTITGDKLVVHASDVSQESLSMMMDRIDRIEVEGNVRISQEDKIAKADKAIYYHGQQKIVLTGDPLVSQGKDSVKGHRITLYLAQERSVVEGSSNAPVKVVLHPDEEQKQQ